ncbi:MAG TPA: hypothetical protein ENI23_17540 [bacterium]|nr:hypothetical protein [bacterium]
MSDAYPEISQVLMVDEGEGASPITSILYEGKTVETTPRLIKDIKIKAINYAIELITQRGGGTVIVPLIGGEDIIFHFIEELNNREFDMNTVDFKVAEKVFAEFGTKSYEIFGENKGIKEGLVLMLDDIVDTLEATELIYKAASEMAVDGEKMEFVSLAYSIKSEDTPFSTRPKLGEVNLDREQNGQRAYELVELDNSLASLVKVQSENRIPVVYAFEFPPKWILASMGLNGVKIEQYVKSVKPLVAIKYLAEVAGELYGVENVPVLDINEQIELAVKLMSETDALERLFGVPTTGEIIDFRQYYQALVNGSSVEDVLNSDRFKFLVEMVQDEKREFLYEQLKIPVPHKRSKIPTAIRYISGLLNGAR